MFVGAATMSRSEMDQVACTPINPHVQGDHHGPSPRHDRHSLLLDQPIRFFSINRSSQSTKPWCLINKIVDVARAAMRSRMVDSLSGH
jgi:hypothetical protein